MKFFKQLSLLAMLTLAVGCSRSVPLHNLDNQTIISQSPLSLETVETSIVKGGRTLGWQIKVVGPGHIVATLNIRRHQAVVDIPFDTEKYSIEYKDSTNLDYDGTRIHPNYYRWVNNLNKEIQRALPINR